MRIYNCQSTMGCAKVNYCNTVFMRCNNGIDDDILETGTRVFRGYGLSIKS